MSRRTQPAIEKQARNLAEAAKHAITGFTAIETVKSHNAQENELRKYGRPLQEAAKQYIVQARANSLQIGSVRFLMLSVFVQGFWYGSHLVSDGKKTSGQILTTFWACLMACQTFEQILPQMIILEKGRAAAATIRAVIAKIDQVETVAVDRSAKTPSFVDGQIEVRNVSCQFISSSHS